MKGRMVQVIHLEKAFLVALGWCLQDIAQVVVVFLRRRLDGACIMHICSSFLGVSEWG